MKLSRNYLWYSWFCPSCFFLEFKFASYILVSERESRGLGPVSAIFKAIPSDYHFRDFFEGLFYEVLCWSEGWRETLSMSLGAQCLKRMTQEYNELPHKKSKQASKGPSASEPRFSIHFTRPRLQPGLERKFPLGKTGRGKICSHCNFWNFHSLTEGNQVSLVRIDFSHPESNGKASVVGVGSNG